MAMWHGGPFAFLKLCSKYILEFDFMYYSHNLIMNEKCIIYFKLYIWIEREFKKSQF